MESPPNSVGSVFGAHWWLAAAGETGLVGFCNSMATCAQPGKGGSMNITYRVHDSPATIRSSGEFKGSEGGTTALARKVLGGLRLPHLWRDQHASRPLVVISSKVRASPFG